jgi:diguanylate cyclase (GGDEF)-like protein
MTLARLLRLSPAVAERHARKETLTPSAAWPYDNPMLLGIPKEEFTASVRRAIWALLGEARNLRSELERTRGLLKDAEQAVDRDHLLPVLNRRAFMRELERQIASASRYATPTSLAYMDIDGLKLANDTQGHACGDAILAHFCALLQSSLRSSDLVGRLGGDEFAVVLLHADEKQAQSTCSRLAELSTSQPLAWRGADIPLRFTFGTVQISAAMDAEAAIAAADAAMYAQKALRQ